jgi:hypothetical protein
MSAYAAVRLTLDLSRRRGAAFYARAIVDAFAGTRNAVVDPAGGELTFDLIFPGNLSALVRQLDGGLIPVGGRASVSLPVRALTTVALADPAAVDRRLCEGAPVWDAQFARGPYVFGARLNERRVEASIVPGNGAMHQLYDALLSLGLMASSDPLDERAPA